MAPGTGLEVREGFSLTVRDSGGARRKTPPPRKAMLAPRGGRTDRRTARCRRGHEVHAAPALGARAADSYLIRFGTEGRSEGPRLGYLCLQQQHVEVGDRLSVDAQELQFISQSVCQLSDLKLPGRKGKSQEPPSGASPGCCGPAAPAFPQQTRFGTTRGPTAWDVPPWPCAPVTPSSKHPQGRGRCGAAG